MKILEGRLGRAIDELDKTLAIVGLIFAGLLIIWLVITEGHPIYLTVGFLSFLACAGYLLLRRYLHPSAAISLDRIEFGSRVHLTLNILFFVLLSYSILSINQELYIRSLGYFISTALMAAVVAVEILLISSHKSGVYLTLFKIILIGLSITWSQILIFPSLVGVDSWYHQIVTSGMLDTGHIPEGLAYSKLPLFHLIIGETSLITGLDYKMAAMLSIGLLHVVLNSLFVFLMGRFIINTKVGLLAALLLMVASFHTWLGLFLIPMAIAAVLILPVLYLLFKLRKGNPALAISLSLLFMVVLIIAHALATMWLAILLFVVLIGFISYNRLYHEKLTVPVSLTIAILFSVWMFGYWIYASGHIFSLAKFIKWGFSEELLGSDPFSGAVAQYILGVPFLEHLFNNLGMFSFFAFSLIGCFYMMSRRSGTGYSFVIVIGGVAILTLGFISFLFGIEALGGRWLYLAQIMLAIPLSLALFLFCGVLNKWLTKVWVMSLSVFLLSFFMIMSPVANIDNNTFSPNTMVRFAFTESELQAAATISNMWNGEIGGDRYYRLSVGSEIDAKYINIDGCFLTGDFTDCQDLLVMIRQEIVESAFQISTHPFKIHYDPCYNLTEQGFSHIYDNGSVSAFVK